MTVGAISSAGAEAPVTDALGGIEAPAEGFDLLLALAAPATAVDADADADAHASSDTDLCTLAATAAGPIVPGPAVPPPGIEPGAGAGGGEAEAAIAAAALARPSPAAPAPERPVAATPAVEGAAGRTATIEQHPDEPVPIAEVPPHEPAGTRARPARPVGGAADHPARGEPTPATPPGRAVADAARSARPASEAVHAVIRDAAPGKGTPDTPDTPGTPGTPGTRPDPAPGRAAADAATAVTAGPAAHAVHAARGVEPIGGGAELPVPEAATPAPTEQLVSALRPLRHGADGSYRLRLELRPPELGRVELRVELRDGVLHASLHADHEHAAAALRDALGDLRSRLELEGVRTGRLTVDHGNSGSRGDRPDRRPERNGAPPVAPAAPPAASWRANAARPLPTAAGRAGLDVRV